jgi:alkanesulfonate monooxygenase SsuD/methylene tetrahydromethanopterin reductase-like flavin-dependent oxidoreductase (luciferase family)
MMTGVFLARDGAELERRMAGRDPAALRERGALVGTGEEIKAQLAEIEAAGVQRVMLQWLQMEDFEGMEALGKAVC